MGYKYLEIGINVGPPSYVEIAIGDNQGHEVIMSIEIWKQLLEEQVNIGYFLQNINKTNFIKIGPLTVRFTKLNNVELVRFELSNVCIIMAESTLNFMFSLDKCIDYIYNRLINDLNSVDYKYTQFTNIASTLSECNAISNAICSSEYYDDNELIDCELLALVFKTSS